MGKERDTGSKRTNVAVFMVCLVVSLAGMALSAELIRVHQQANDPTGPAPTCAFGEGVDCSPVALNEWGRILGVPTAAWGLLTYAGFALLALLGTLRRVFPNGPGGLIFWGSLPCLGFGGFLVYIMVYEIQSLCVYCLGLDAVHLGLVACGVFAVLGRGAVSALREDIATLLENKPSMVAIFGGPLFAGFLIYAVCNSTSTGGDPDVLPDMNLPDAGMVEPPDDDTAPSIGPRDALITVYEFSDYQCPFCRRAHTEAREVIEQYPEQIRFVHFHHPLDIACNPAIDQPFHPAACLAAAAAICAEERDKFWELNDLLFEHGRRLDEELILSLAGQVGLDRSEMSRCMESERTRERILEDLEEALQIPVRGTPTFIVNGRLLPGYLGPQLEVAIRHLLAHEGRWPTSSDDTDRSDDE